MARVLGLNSQSDEHRLALGHYLTGRRCVGCAEPHRYAIVFVPHIKALSKLCHCQGFRVRSPTRFSFVPPLNLRLDKTQTQPACLPTAEVDALAGQLSATTARGSL